MSGDAARLRVPPRNPAMAGGIDHPEITHEVWVCGPPRGDYPGSVPNGLIDRCKPWMNGPGLVAFAGLLRVPGALHVDLDPTVDPDVVGDVADLPNLVGERRFAWIFADPPYGEEYARAMYRTARLRREGTLGRADKDKRSSYWPHRWLSAMSRVLLPGGFLLYLDQLVPYGPRGTVCVRRAFVHRGTNMRATCLSIFRRSGRDNGNLKKWVDDPLNEPRGVVL